MAPPRFATSGRAPSDTDNNDRANERAEAVDHLLEIVQRQRSWNEEAARQQLVKLFAAFGATDPLTVDARKRLSRILFA